MQPHEHEIVDFGYIVFSFLSYSALAGACTDSIRETVGKCNKMIEEVGVCQRKE